MEKELNDSTCRIATLEREKEALETHAQQLEEDLACQENHRNTLEQDAGKLLEKVKGLREKVRGLREEVRETEVHAEDLRRQLYLINQSRIWRLRCKIIAVKKRLTGRAADNSDEAPPL
jgi:predicted  nucleic acid-binding Zn-ribbon protein